MMRLQAAPPTSGLSALAAHSSQSAGVAASTGIASSRATQRSSPPDPHAAMLFPLRLALRCDTYGRDDFSPNGRHHRQPMSEMVTKTSRPPAFADGRPYRHQASWGHHA